MDELADLQKRLSRTNDEAMQRWGGPYVDAMAKIADGLADKLKSTSQASTMPEQSERILQAVRRFRERNGDIDYRTLRLVTFGCCQFFVADRYAIVCDRALVEAMLLRVADYRQNPRALRRLYGGLLGSYLTADRYAEWFSPEAMVGTELLRRYLAENREMATAVQPPLQRLTALNRHPQVLELDAGRYFARQWLAGEHEFFWDVTEKLEITGASWLAAETLKAALRDASAAGDDQFIGHIPALLQAAAEPRFQPIRDHIYEGLVTRYAAMPSPPVHRELRDALVAAWKNPWMSRNDGAWGRVPDHARKLVAGWVKLELIHQFFEVLSDDGRQDRRRFEFWRKYYEQIDDVYFALSGDSYRSVDPDMVKLRVAAEDRFLELTGAAPKTHAFVMCMGSKVVVEFSQTANAVHTFSRDLLRVTSTSKSVSMSMLKIAIGDGRWIHRGAWEDDFRRRLSGQAMPQKAQPTMPSRRPEFIDAQPQWSTRNESRAEPQASNSGDEMITFARMRGIAVDDRRPWGGNLWFIFHGQDPAIIARLQAWGFSSKQGKGWWKGV